MESASIPGPGPNTAAEGVRRLVNECDTLVAIYAQGRIDKARPWPEEYQVEIRFLAWKVLVGAGAEDPPDELDQRLQRTCLENSVVPKLQELADCLRFGTCSSFYAYQDSHYMYSHHPSGVETRTKHEYKSYKENKKDFKRGYESICKVLGHLESMAVALGRAHESNELMAVKTTLIKLDPDDEGGDYMQSCYPGASLTLLGQLQMAVMSRRLQTVRQQELASHESGSAHDHQPLVCISEKCGLLPPSFSTTAEWKLHMRANHGVDWPRFIHRTQWQCPYCPEESHSMNRQYLIRHLLHPAMAHRHSDEGVERFHARRFDWFEHRPTHIPTVRFMSLVRASWRTVPLKDGFCPLCQSFSWTKLGEGDEGDDIEEHLASHIRHIFSNFPCFNFPC